MALADIASCQGEEPADPKSRWDRGHFDGYRSLVVAWSDRVTALTAVDTSPDCFWPYPDGPSNTPSRRAEIEGIGAQVGGAGGIAAYELARLKVTYSTRGPKWDADKGYFYEERILPCSRTFPIDWQLLEWQDSVDLTEEEMFDRPTYEFEYQCIHHKVSVIPDWVMGAVGCVNSNIVTASQIGWIFAPQTLLYMCPTMHRKVFFGGRDLWDVAVTYKYNPLGWNNPWRSQTYAFEPVYLKDGHALYR